MDPQKRAFEFTNEEWKRLVLAYCKICDREPKLYDYDFRACKTDFDKRWDILEAGEDFHDDDSQLSENELENEIEYKNER